MQVPIVCDISDDSKNRVSDLEAMMSSACRPAGRLAKQSLIEYSSIPTLLIANANSAQIAKLQNELQVSYAKFMNFKRDTASLADKMMSFLKTKEVQRAPPLLIATRRQRGNPQNPPSVASSAPRVSSSASSPSNLPKTQSSRLLSDRTTEVAASTKRDIVAPGTVTLAIRRNEIVRVRDSWEVQCQRILDSFHGAWVTYRRKQKAPISPMFWCPFESPDYDAFCELIAPKQPIYFELVEMNLRSGAYGGPIDFSRDMMEVLNDFTRWFTRINEPNGRNQALELKAHFEHLYKCVCDLPKADHIAKAKYPSGPLTNGKRAECVALFRKLDPDQHDKVLDFLREDLPQSDDADIKLEIQDLPNRRQWELYDFVKTEYNNNRIASQESLCAPTPASREKGSRKSEGTTFSSCGKFPSSGTSFPHNAKIFPSNSGRPSNDADFPPNGPSFPSSTPSFPSNAPSFPSNAPSFPSSGPSFPSNGVNTPSGPNFPAVPGGFATHDPKLSSNDPSFPLHGVPSLDSRPTNGASSPVMPLQHQQAHADASEEEEQMFPFRRQKRARIESAALDEAEPEPVPQYQHPFSAMTTFPVPAHPAPVLDMPTMPATPPTGFSMIDVADDILKEFEDSDMSLAFGQSSTDTLNLVASPSHAGSSAPQFSTTAASWPTDSAEAADTAWSSWAYWPSYSTDASANNSYGSFPGSAFGGNEAFPWTSHRPPALQCNRPL